MGQVPKPVLVQTLILESSIEAFDKAVLSWLSRLYKLQFHTVSIGPLVQSLTGLLRPLIRSGSLRIAAEGGYNIQGVNLITRAG